MASRYWVGGTASWDATAGTKWSTTSGGAGGASVPTSSDDVFFDANSGASTVTVSATANCLNLNFTGFTGTLSGSSTINIYGSFTANVSMGWSHTGILLFSATSGSNTITTNGRTLSSTVTVGLSSSSGVDWTLGSALTTSGNFILGGATFSTGNYNLTASSLQSYLNTAVRTLNFGSSTITLTSGGSSAATYPLNLAATSTNLTVNAGTSTIVFATSSSIGAGCLFSNHTFYNVSFANTTAGWGFTLFAGASQAPTTFSNFSVTGPSAAGYSAMYYNTGPIVINGTFSTTGTAGNRRIWFRNSTYGLTQTITVNGSTSLTDADFRDIYVVGTAAPISGTRIGDLRGNRGITFSTPKTVYWVTAAGGNWSGNNWAASSGGAASTDNFPLAQDTAKIENTGLNTSATVTLDAAITYVGTVDMSTRTNAMTIGGSTAYTIYGDLTTGSGTTYSGVVFSTFSGRNTQTITSSGKSYTSNITVDSYGGTVQLADALNLGSNTLTVTNGTFDTKNYNVTAGTLSSSNTNVRTITLGSSTVTLSATSAPLQLGTTSSTNITYNCGTSTLNITGTLSSATLGFGPGLTHYNVNFTSTSVSSVIVSSGTATTTFNNLSITAPASAGISTLGFAGNQTINGTLTVAGASAVQRIFLRSDTLGTTRTLTVNSLSATDCDFRDITIAGAAAGSSPTRAGDCGGNTGITFPAPKTVYFVSGTYLGSGWATSSGGSTSADNLPLAQDTGVIDNNSPASFNIASVNFNTGTIDASARTTALTMSFSVGTITCYGGFKTNSNVTTSGNNAITFQGRGSNTITSAGGTISASITVDCFSGTVQLADAIVLGSTSQLTLLSGTFDAVSYNVTTGAVLFNPSASTPGTVKMGSGTWTLSGTGTVWNIGGTLAFYKGTADIVLSNTSTSARTFAGNSFSYNKLTIGGTTGTSTLTITGNNQFTEIASTKTVAHTIALGTTTQTFGKWSVTGTIGNVVSLSGSFTIIIAGDSVSGVNYLSNTGVGSVSSTSPGAFYAGANSTNPGGGANFILTAAPAPRTLYWVGGTGNWNDTAHWSTSSGGASGAAIPTSLDAVNFNSASNATAYTVTVNAASLRCGSLTMAGPASGNVTWAGSNPLYIHGSVSLAATGITRTYTGAITLSSSSTGLTFTTNGNTLASAITVNGVSCGWTLGSALNIGTSNLTVTNGSFSTGNYNVTCQQFNSNNTNTRSVTLGSSTVDVADTLSFTDPTNLTFSCGTSQVNLNGYAATLNSGGQTFYNVSYTTANANTTVVLTGAATFNNLTKAGVSASGITLLQIRANQTINGTLTLSAGGNATQRSFVCSDVIGTTRTLTCAAFSGTDVDFRDIAIAGAAAPVSGTRLGDCKGNSGITFDAPKTVYVVATNTTQWSNNIWATSVGGIANTINFPLAQDIAVIPSANPTSGQTVTINASYNIGTIDMSARTSNTMALATGTTTPAIYGNWINGTGTTLTGTGIMTFAGRGTQTITSAGKTFTQGFLINSPGGSLTLQDALTVSLGASNAIELTSGTFDASTFNVTISSTAGGFRSSNSNTRTIAIGSGTWTIAGDVPWNAGTSTGLTVTGSGVLKTTLSTAKTFQGGSVSYSGITLDQGGAGTLTITGNNTFKNITNSYSATGATTITLGTTTQTVTQFTATGTSGKVLTVQGTSASSPATLILSGATKPNVDYLTITGVRAYSLDSTWYAGANSTNNGSLGWYFEAAGGGAISATITETATGTDVVQVVTSTFNPAVSESATGTDSILSRVVFRGNINETGTASDLISALKTQLAQILESASGSDTVSAKATFKSLLSDTATGSDQTAAKQTFKSTVSDTASISDAVRGGLLFLGSISESATAADVVRGLKAYFSAVSEGASISDAVRVAASTFNARVQETATETDAASAKATFKSNTADTATGTDAISPKKTTRPVISESATASDKDAAKIRFVGRVAETATITDSPRVAPSTFNAVALAVATAVDTPRANAVFQSQVVNTATIQDSLIGGFLWNLIDDSQSVTWATVANAQTSGWTVIDDSQSPGWQNVDTL